MAIDKKLFIHYMAHIYMYKMCEKSKWLWEARNCFYMICCRAQKKAHPSGYQIVGLCYTYACMHIYTQEVIFVCY